MLLEDSQINKGRNMTPFPIHTIQGGGIIPNFSYANQRAAAPNPVFNRKSGFQFQPKPQQANQDQGTTVDEKLNFIITSMMQDKQEKHKTDMAINKHNFSN